MAATDRAGTGVASFAQQRNWFLERIDEDGSAYTVVYCLRLIGTLDPAALHAALEQVVARHAPLRTTFRMRGDTLEQRVAPASALALGTVDLTRPGAPDLAELLRREQRTVFDLERGPVLRATLAREAADRHALIVTVHHIAVDARSLQILRGELAAAYNARLKGGGAAAPEPAAVPEFDYPRYALLQRERVAGPWLAAELEHWRSRLADAARLDLPTDRVAPSVRTAAGGYVTEPLPASLVSGLRALGARRGAGLGDVFGAAVAVLLRRYCDQTDIVLGTSMPGRDDARAAELIGPFANTAVVRTDLSEAPDFHTVLERHRRARAEAAEHASVPFDLVVSELRPDRAAGGRTPLFQVYCDVDEQPDHTPFEGLRALPVPPEIEEAKFDLAFGLHTGPDGDFIDSGYSADLFGPDSARRMLGHLSTLLAAVVADPAADPRDLDLLTAAELDTILDAWNRTEQAYPEDACLHELFERSAAARPAALAIARADERIGYGELDRRAADLAAGLVRAGVRPGDVVGLCLRRSPTLAVATLGVLKAGAAFLPLDPDYPQGRLDYMIADSGCSAVLAEAGTRPAAARTLDPAVIEADGRLGAPLPRVTPDQPAYVIYTSGSTGEPKGIVLRHRGAVNNFTDFNRRFAIGGGDSLLTVSSPSFDMSVYDLLGTLAAGATLVYPDADAAREPGRWLETIRAHGVTVWHSAPALLDLLLDHAEAPHGAGALATLRLALLGGDWIPVTQPERLRRAAPAVRFVGLGGATEASMDSILFEVDAVDPDWASIPYGRPMANQRAYILDDRRHPVPAHVPGELHLAGTGLALGYLGRAELTAQRFFDLELPGGRTERVYRTGDLARYRADGVIELLGRLDFQVKVHGLRIESGEVEAALRRHAAVRDAAVVAQGERGNTVLTAAVVLAPGANPEPSWLRAWLEQILPTAMVPARFLFPDRLPTTPNGKVDRRALASAAPRADRSAVSPPEAVPAAGTAPEEQDGQQEQARRRVAAVWCELLGLDRVGPDENFFDLGGDSFTAVRAAALIDPALPVIELFKSPTVRGLAARLAELGEPMAILQPLRPAPDAQDPVLVCVPYGGGSATAFRDLAEQLPESLAVYGVSLPGHDPSAGDGELVGFDESVLRCADEIEAGFTGPVSLYGHCAGSMFTVALARELEDRGLDLRTVIIGASLPYPDPEQALRAEAETSDEQWAGYLRSIGGLEGPLDTADLGRMMRVGRHDHIGAMTFRAATLRTPPEPVLAPLLCVYGLEDGELPEYPTLYPDWELYAEAVSMREVPGGHYFVHTHAAQLAAIVLERLTAVGQCEAEPAGAIEV